MRRYYNWNPVYNLVMEIKDAFNKIYKVAYDEVIIGEKKLSCLENWIDVLDIAKYTKIFSMLQVNQSGTMMLIRYGRYSDIYSGESEISPEDFWDSYNGFYRECRSIVIDLEKEEIVLAPFKKFRNLGEGEENSVENVKNRIPNANSIEITNKLDGSMQSARAYHGIIIMSGSQALDKEKSWRLTDGYNILMADKNYTNMILENPNYTFIFEYISLSDAHVVKYSKSQEGLYLIGMRNVVNGCQLSYRIVKKCADAYGVKMTQILDKTFDEIMEDSHKYKSDELEGFVVNIDGFMFKLKCDDYVQIHKILSNISSVNLIIKNIADDTFDDLISKVPDVYKGRVSNIAKLVFKYITDTDLEVKRLFNITPKNDRKTFFSFVESEVPKQYQKYVINLYLGRENNYLKSHHRDPHYKNMKEMGYTEDYSVLFVSEEDYEE